MINTLLKTSHHILICGETGSGKTVLAARIFGQAPGVHVFLNIQDERLRCPSAVTMDHWDHRVLARHRRVNINPNINDAAWRALADDIVYDLMSLGRMQCAARPSSHWCTLYVDEAHVFLPSTEAHAEIIQALRRGKRYGIRVVLISQNPPDILKSARTQCHYHVLFELSDYCRPYLRDHAIPYDTIRERTMQRYNWVVWDGRTVSPPCRLQL